jgi:hypothetical protein
VIFKINRINLPIIIPHSPPPKRERREGAKRARSRNGKARSTEVWAHFGGLDRKRECAAEADWRRPNGLLVHPDGDRADAEPAQGGALPRAPHPAVRRSAPHLQALRPVSRRRPRMTLHLRRPSSLERVHLLDLETHETGPVVVVSVNPFPSR